MKIAVLSGKGGTGKTFVSVNLAAALPNAVYVDCDVEEPNGRLFFRPQEIKTQSVTVRIPVIDHAKCACCRKCVDFCKFNALVHVGGKVMIFEDICHSCGGCILLCPQMAYSERKKEIGKIETGFSENVKVVTGELNTGEASGVPIIKTLIAGLSLEENDSIIDCPPGSACVVMESVKEADYCILVAEPTIFGAHNLNMVYELVGLFGKPFGVVLNQCNEADNPSEEFCIRHNIPILEKIPFSREIGDMNSNGQIAAREMSKYKDLFIEMYSKVSKEVQG